MSPRAADAELFGLANNNMHTGAAALDIGWRKRLHIVLHRVLLQHTSCRIPVFAPEHSAKQLWRGRTVCRK
jgi:hypothetical protein